MSGLESGLVLGNTFYTNQVGPRSGDNLISPFWNNGLVQIDCRGVCVAL